MDRLMHNQVIRITTGEHAATYRVVFDDPRRNCTVVARIAGDLPTQHEGQSKSTSAHPPSKTRLSRAFVGALIWLEHEALEQLHAQGDLLPIDVDPEAIYLTPITHSKHLSLFERRRLTMADFLNPEQLREGIIVHEGLGGLARDAMRRAQVSRYFVYSCWSLLCRYGITESSLRPRLDRCGAPSVKRPCDPGGRKKAGRKTSAERLKHDCGGASKPRQPGMSTAWRAAILAADRTIPSPKPPIPERCDRILASHFVRRYRYEGDQLIAVDLKQGEYPNRPQIRRVLDVDIPRLERLLQRTTKGHYARSLRGASGRGWRGIAGPGHAWAIDSTIGDIYLRSSIDRSWIVGRPIVYVIVDQWSTAIVGFYVCLAGPSWAMAKLGLFCAAAPRELVGDLWGYQPIACLSPEPTLPAMIFSDRGEYLSRLARETGASILRMQSYAPPYRPDYRGLNEVLHRIEKDKQYHFAPGAINARRAEYELRKFRPGEAMLTVREYVHYLHLQFAEYNLTADRSSRMDPHMQAAGVFPSPAGLWRWGHDIGIGFARRDPTSALVSSLLLPGTARVTRSGIRFGSGTYASAETEQRKWIDVARNFGGSHLACHYFPGSAKMIWTPDLDGAGLLELGLSDNSEAVADSTFDEMADAAMYAKCRQADIDHHMTVTRLGLREGRKGIVENAIERTKESIDHAQGSSPTLTESRQVEIAATMHGGAAPEHAQSPSHQDAPPLDYDETFLPQLSEILAHINEEDDDHASA